MRLADVNQSACSDKPITIVLCVAKVPRLGGNAKPHVKYRHSDNVESCVVYVSEVLCKKVSAQVEESTRCVVNTELPVSASLTSPGCRFGVCGKAFQ